MEDIFFLNTKYFENCLIAEGFEDLIASPFIQRLKNVTYLSTADHIFYNKHCFNRYEHSIATGYVALLLAHHLNLPKKDILLFVIANLIHDIGHIAFSHAAETFLLEKKRKYHGGLFHLIINENSPISINGENLPDLLKTRYGLSDELINILPDFNNSNFPILHQLQQCSIDCDKIDGTNRSLFAFRDDYTDPLLLIKCFQLVNKKIIFSVSNLDTLVNFWKQKKHLYHSYIYTEEVSVAEAMLTRALELSLPENVSLSQLLSYSDSDLIDIIKSTPNSAPIINCFLKRKYFKSLKKNNNNLFKRYNSALIQNRFDDLSRKKIERDISHSISSPYDFVISHFSFRKNFHVKIGQISQMNLFSDNRFITINSLNKSFYKRKISGAFLDVFYK